MDQDNITYKGSVLKTPKFTKDLGHNIEQVIKTDQGILVRLEFGLKSEGKLGGRNIVMISYDGEFHRTIADSNTPGPGTFRPYVGIAEEPEGLRLHTGFGADYRVDLTTGAVTLFDFSK